MAETDFLKMFISLLLRESNFQGLLCLFSGLKRKAIYAFNRMKRNKIGQLNTECQCINFVS